MEIGYRSEHYGYGDDMVAIPSGGKLEAFIRSLEGVKDSPFVARIPGTLFITAYVGIYNHQRSVDKVVAWAPEGSENLDEHVRTVAALINQWLPKKSQAVEKRDVFVSPCVFLVRDEKGRVRVDSTSGRSVDRFVRFNEHGGKGYISTSHVEMASLEWPLK